MATYKITQTETHITEADSKNEVLQLWNEGAIDGAGTLTVSIEEIPNAHDREYLFISGNRYAVKASSEKEAWEKMNNYWMSNSDDDAEELDVETILEETPCHECPSDSHGWHKNNNAGITYEGLKKAQNEAIIQGIKYAMDYLEDINAHHSANALAHFLDLLTENTFETIPEWQRDFFAKHSFYSTECEGAN